MSPIKLLTLESCEWLPSLGDYDKLLIQFSISEEEQKDATKQYIVIVKLTRSLLTFWVKKNPELSDRSNIEKVLLQYATEKIRERVKNSGTILSEEELLLDTSAQFTPPSPATIQVPFGQPEEIVVERKFGFPS
ncbi:MAG: hypothetical protein A2W35_21590 [Chloroflexi bacterium RBG_16_57_11]|nr:MAG: hypothetical protein A2W35_21590 [Chloroflexi bacterium RBG_16_57_11]